jgi:putative polyhydroxyalkanoate system protein
MADIHIHRDHQLGLAKAREVAWQWAEDVERQFDMACTVIEGETSDTVEFTRSGVKGRLIVAADHFDLDAKLGFLLGAFSKTIEAEIEKNLDGLLGQAGALVVAKGGKSAKPVKSAKAAAPATPAVPAVAAAASKAGKQPAAKTNDNALASAAKPGAKPRRQA